MLLVENENEVGIYRDVMGRTLTHIGQLSKGPSRGYGMNGLHIGENDVIDVLKRARRRLGRLVLI